MFKEKMLNKIYDIVLYNYSIKKSVFQILKSNLIVKNPVYNFIYKKEMQNKIEKYAENPFRVIIENTNGCNANCVFCPHKKMQRTIGFMNYSLFKKIVDECSSVGIDYITIYGFGEPLIDPEFSEKVKYAKSKGIKRVTTNTNGYFLNEERVKEIVEAGLDEIYISIDAATEATYNKIRTNLEFKMVENNIKDLLKLKQKNRLSKPLVILSYVESKLNEQETKKFISKWKNIADNISISRIHNWTGDIYHDRINNTRRRKDPCRLIWTEMVISWDGRVPLCCNDYDNRIILGDIKTDSIKKIWSEGKIKKIRNYHKNEEFNKVSICKNCEYNYHDKSNWWVSK